MKPQSGRQHFHIGGSSSINDVFADRAGHDSYKEHMRQFPEHAGLKSGEKVTCGRKAGFSLASSMDELVWGHDLDKSGGDPNQHFRRSYGAGYAGRPTADLPRGAKKAGGYYSLTSTMDDVLWGRDLDRSGVDPHENYRQKFSDHAGGASGQRQERQHVRRFLLGQVDGVDDVVAGVDWDDSTGRMAKYAEDNKGIAGVRSAPKPERPTRRSNTHMQSSADGLIWHRDLDKSGQLLQQEVYEQAYAGFAGLNSARRPKSARSARLEKSKSEITLKVTGEADIISAGGDAPSSPTAAPAATNYLRPATGARGCTKRPQRSVSQGSLTSREYGAFFLNSNAPEQMQQRPSAGKVSDPFARTPRSASIGPNLDASCGSTTAPNSPMPTDVDSPPPAPAAAQATPCARDPAPSPAPSAVPFASMDALSAAGPPPPSSCRAVACPEVTSEAPAKPVPLQQPQQQQEAPLAAPRKPSYQYPAAAKLLERAAQRAQSDAGAPAPPRRTSVASSASSAAWRR